MTNVIRRKCAETEKNNRKSIVCTVFGDRGHFNFVFRWKNRTFLISACVLSVAGPWALGDINNEEFHDSSIGKKIISEIRER